MRGNWKTHRVNPPAVQHHEPPIQAQEPPIEGRVKFWPNGMPMPETYGRRRVPCPNCRRVFMDGGGQAVLCQSTSGGVAYLRCRVCGYHFKMEVG